MQELREAGLLVTDPFPSGHAWEHGVRIGKPTTTPSNSIPDFLTGYDDISMNAPMIVLYRTEKDWVVIFQDHAPTPVSGDFENHWPTAEDAVKDVLDFYLRKLERMNEIAAAMEETKMRVRQAQNHTR